MTRAAPQSAQLHNNRPKQNVSSRFRIEEQTVFISFISKNAPENQHEKDKYGEKNCAVKYIKAG